MKAFPQLDTKTYDQFRDKGMDLRDYFAAKAMDKVTFGGYPRIQESNEGWKLRDAKICYEIADAMMKARNND